MTPADLMQALVPVFPPSIKLSSRGFSKRGVDTWAVMLSPFTTFHAF